MNEDPVLQRLKEEERQIIIDRTKAAASMMAVPLVLSFSIVDYYFVPELVGEFLLVRLLIIPTCIAAYLLFRISAINERHFAIPAFLVAIFLGCYNSYLAARTGGAASAYYAGLNLVAIGGLYFLPLSLKQLTILFACIYFPYFVMTLTTYPLNVNILAPNYAFILSTAFLGFVVNIFNRRLRTSEITAKVRLENELLTKESIIKRKTQEGIYLEKLAGQFSPQVIDAIKQGQLSIGQIIRREITCIFIDIANSTARSSRLDYSAYTTLVSQFFTECIEIFLEHNVTVGTYLGDGILAFTNAPQSITDHKVHAVKACLKILEVQSKKERFFHQKWRTDFIVRVGINSGWANIGFFPNEKRGTYTAIGECVNLASRLCARAKENSICVTKDLALEIASEIPKLNVSHLINATDLKGFEGENFELFTIRPSESEVLTAFDGCPLCGAKLIEESDLVDSTLLRCTKCRYTDLVPKVKRGAA